MESQIVRKVPRMAVDASSRNRDSRTNNRLSDLDESFLTESEREAIGILSPIRAEQLKRTLTANERIRRGTLVTNEEACRRTREFADRVNASTRLDAEEHSSLVGARLAETAERIGQLLGAVIDKRLRRHSSVVPKI